MLFVRKTMMVSKTSAAFVPAGDVMDSRVGLDFHIVLWLTDSPYLCIFVKRYDWNHVLQNMEVAVVLSNWAIDPPKGKSNSVKQSTLNTEWPKMALFSEMAKDESKGKGVDVKSLSSKQYLDQVEINFEWSSNLRFTY